MEAMTKTWTDERLEERFDRIDQRFDDVDRRIGEIDRRFEQRFDHVDADFRESRTEINARFDAMNGRHDATQRLIIQIGAGTMATILAGFLGLIATHF
jgi:hypothetical protein